MVKYKIGDRVMLKKGHPCGNNEWIIKRTGVEIKLECSACGRMVMMKRTDFHKWLRKIMNEEGKFVSIVNFERAPERDA